MAERPVWDRKVAGSMPAAPTTRRCRTCGKVLPIDQYYEGSGPGGRFTKCKACCRQYVNERNRAARRALRALESGETRQSADEIRAMPDDKLVGMVMRKRKLRLWITDRIESIEQSGMMNPVLQGSVAAFRQVIRWLDNR